MSLSLSLPLSLWFQYHSTESRLGMFLLSQHTRTCAASIVTICLINVFRRVCLFVLQRTDEEAVVDRGGTRSMLNTNFEKEELEGTTSPGQQQTNKQHKKQKQLDHAQSCPVPCFTVVLLCFDLTRLIPISVHNVASGSENATARYFFQML